MSDGRNLSVNFTASSAPFVKSVAEIRQSLDGLNRQYAENKQKIKETNDEIKSLKKQEDALNEARDKGIKDPQLTQKLTELKDKLAQANVQLGQLKTNEQQLNSQIKATTAEFKQHYEAIGQVGENALTTGDIIKANLISEAVLSGVKKLGSAFKELIFDSALAADDINTMAAQYGMSADEIQKFRYASELIDVSIETLSTTMARNIRSMSSYKKGTAEVVAAYDALGISVIGANGELRDSHAVYNEIISALGKMQNETERDALAMQLLGKSAQDINPLILGGAEALAQMGEQAEKLGLILSQEQLDNLNSLNDKVDVTKANFQALGMVVAEEFAGSFDKAFEAGDEFVEFIQELKSEGTLKEIADGVSNSVAGTVGVIQTAIKLGWDYRGVILAGAAAFVTFKTSMSINTTIDTLGRSFITLTTNIGKAEGAANKLKAAFSVSSWTNVAALITSVVVSAIVLYTTAMSNANKVTAESVQQSLDKAKQSREEVDELKKLAEEYKNLGKKTSLTGDEKNRLVEIQGVLNDKYLNEAQQIDVLNGKYSEQLNNLKELSEEKAKYAKYNAEVALADAKKLYNDKKSIPHNVNEDTFSLLTNSSIKGISDNFTDSDMGLNINIIGTPEEKVKSISQILDLLIERGKTSEEIFASLTNEYSDNIDKIDNLATAEKALFIANELSADGTKNLVNDLKDLSNNVDYTTKALTDLISETKSYTSAIDEQNKNGRISAETALKLKELGYANVITLNNETGALQLKTEALKQATEAIYNDEKARIQAQVNIKMMELNTVNPYNEKERHEKLLKEIGDLNSEILIINSLSYETNQIDSPLYSNYQKEYEEAAKKRISLIQEEAKERKSKAEIEIQAIKDEIETQRQNMSDLEHQKEVNEINAQLKYGQLDEISRYELERKKAELIKKQDDILWERGKNIEIKKIQERSEKEQNVYGDYIKQINEAVATVGNVVSDLKSGITTISNIMNTDYSTNIDSRPNFNFNNVPMTESQLVDLFKKALFELTY